MSSGISFGRLMSPIFAFVFDLLADWIPPDERRRIAQSPNAASCTQGVECVQRLHRRFRRQQSPIPRSTAIASLASLLPSRMSYS
jgi:hypothetical protein